MRTTIRRWTTGPRGLALVPTQPTQPAGQARAHNAPAPGEPAVEIVYRETAQHAETAQDDETVYDGAPWGGAAYGGEPTGAGALDVSADEHPSRTTVIALSCDDTGPGTAAVVAAIAELATQDELSIVYGHAEPAPGRLNTYAFVGALRFALPRYSIAAVLLDPHPHKRSTDYAVLRELLEDGAVSVAAVSVTDPTVSAVELAEHLPADRVLQLTYDPTSGVVTHLLWSRQGTPDQEAA